MQTFKSPILHISYFILHFILFLHGNITAQIISRTDIDFACADNTGAIYAVRNHSLSLVKYSTRGDSLASYRSNRLGRIGYVETADALRILVWHPESATVVLIDRMLRPLQSFSLYDWEVIQPEAIGLSPIENSLWIYDAADRFLKNFDNKGNLIRKSGDLSLVVDEKIAPNQLICNGLYIYILNTDKRVSVFDKSGNFVKNINIEADFPIFIYDENIYYTRAGLPYYFDTLQQKEFELKTDNPYVKIAIPTISGIRFVTDKGIF